ncbi:hypothetical protein KQH68_09945 [Streptococcus sanguinis]|uniref:hypothetical protein n=1 Tax=Streptococcus sanguinis TaxID=1305 RepID=UPI000F682A27|nr:hypothetical protein [Streptococcus sanguinis]RSH99644.1 hypothetical protein D8891_05415 [Streptococcus sanguinis]
MSICGFIVGWISVFIIIHSVLIHRWKQVNVNNSSCWKLWKSKFFPNLFLYLIFLICLSLFGTLSISTWAVVTAIVALIKELLSKNTAKYKLEIDSKGYNEKSMHNLFLVILLAVILLYISLSVIDELEVYAYQRSTNLTVFFNKNYLETFHDEFEKLGLVDNLFNKMLTALIRMSFIELEIFCLGLVYFFIDYAFKISFGRNLWSSYEKMMGSQTYYLNGSWHEINSKGKVTVNDIFYISSGKLYDRVNSNKKFAIIVDNGQVKINKDGKDVILSVEELKDNGKLKIDDRYFINKNSSIYKETKKQGKVLLQRVPLFFGSKSKNIEFDSRDF